MTSIEERITTLVGEAFDTITARMLDIENPATLARVYLKNDDVVYLTWGSDPIEGTTLVAEVPLSITMTKEDLTAQLLQNYNS